MNGADGGNGRGTDELRLAPVLRQIFQSDMTCHLDEFLGSINRRTFSSWFSQLDDPTINLAAWSLDLSRYMDVTITFIGCSSPASLCIATVVREVDLAVWSIIAQHECDRASQIAEIDAIIAELAACAESAPNDLDEFLEAFEGERVEPVPSVPEAAPDMRSLSRKDVKRLRGLVGKLRPDDPIDLYIGKLVKRTVERSGVYVSLERGHREVFSPTNITRPTLTTIETLINGLQLRPFNEYTSDDES
jgi:hypothetical protein